MDLGRGFIRLINIIIAYITYVFEDDFWIFSNQQPRSGGRDPNDRTKVDLD